MNSGSKATEVSRCKRATRKWEKETPRPAAEVIHYLWNGGNFSHGHMEGPDPGLEPAPKVNTGEALLARAVRGPAAESVGPGRPSVYSTHNQKWAPPPRPPPSRHRAHQKAHSRGQEGDLGGMEDGGGG